MNRSLHLELLAAACVDLSKGLEWLQRSADMCASKFGSQEWSMDDYDAFEALTGRFARVSDMLLQKFFRALDVVELSEGGTLLDVLLRAEKRGLVESADEFLEIRELRNEIAHEYAEEDLKSLFLSVYQNALKLIVIAERSLRYAKDRYLQAPKDDETGGAK